MCKLRALLKAKLNVLYDFGEILISLIGSSFYVDIDFNKIFKEKILTSFYIEYLIFFCFFCSVFIPVFVFKILFIYF